MRHFVLKDKVQKVSYSNKTWLNAFQAWSRSRKTSQFFILNDQPLFCSNWNREWALFFSRDLHTCCHSNQTSWPWSKGQESVKLRHCWPNIWSVGSSFRHNNSNNNNIHNNSSSSSNNILSISKSPFSSTTRCQTRATAIRKISTTWTRWMEPTTTSEISASAAKTCSAWAKTSTSWSSPTRSTTWKIFPEMKTVPEVRRATASPTAPRRRRWPVRRPVRRLLRSTPVRICPFSGRCSSLLRTPSSPRHRDKSSEVLHRHIRDRISVPTLRHRPARG